MIYRMLASLIFSFSLVAGVVGNASANNAIIVGGKKFTEQQLVAEMTAQLLRANGYKVDKRADLGSSVLRAAQENGQVDVYWEYTGTSLITYNKITDKLSAEQTYKRISELDAQKGITWLNPSKANNTYALAMRKVDAEKGFIDAARIAHVADHKAQPLGMMRQGNGHFMMFPLIPRENGYQSRSVSRFQDMLDKSTPK